MLQRGEGGFVGRGIAIEDWLYVRSSVNCGSCMPAMLLLFSMEPGDDIGLYSTEDP